jgi:hypothetical protein
VEILTPTDSVIDFEQELIGFYLAQPSLAATFGTSMWPGTFPVGAGDAQFPALTVARSGGGDDLGDVTLDHPSIQHQVWGPLQDYPAAMAAASVLRSLLLAWTFHGTLNTGTVQAACEGVVSHVTSVEPNTGRPVILIDATFTVATL